MTQSFSGHRRAFILSSIHHSTEVGKATEKYQGQNRGRNFAQSLKKRATDERKWMGKERINLVSIAVGGGSSPSCKEIQARTVSMSPCAQAAATSRVRWQRAPSSSCTWDRVLQ